MINNSLIIKKIIEIRIKNKIKLYP